MRFLAAAARLGNRRVVRVSAFLAGLWMLSSTALAADTWTEIRGAHLVIAKGSTGETRKLALTSDDASRQRVLELKQTIERQKPPGL